MVKNMSRQLRVFLDNQSFRIEDVDHTQFRNYLGGVGYASKILYDELGKDVDPIGPENKIIFATGPLTSYEVPGGGSIEICFKSPLTNAWGESRCGGNFGPDLKKAGYDYLIIEGKAPKPIFLFIDDNKVKFYDGSKLIGKTVSEKNSIIREQFHDETISIMCIGIAGENLVKISAVMSESRAAGRCGAGAVMGSKNLIAIAVKGSGRLKAENEDAFKEALREARRVIKESDTAKGFRQFGTIGDMVSNDADGDWPTKNWQSNSWGKAEELYAHYINNNYVKHKMCYKGCPIACGRIVKVEEGKYKTPEHEGAEYESVSAFTAFVVNENVDAAIYCDYLCNEFGIDTISVGALIAFAMECYESKLISLQETGGLDLSWGNADILPVVIEKISKREGIGDLLADGVLKAAKKIGKEAEGFAVHCKGLEGPAHDPRSGKLLAVTYGTANRGMCHIHPLEGMAYDRGKVDWGLSFHGVPDPNSIDRWDEKGKGAITKILQDGLVLPDILGVCKFFMYAGLSLEHYSKLLSALTGMEFTPEDLLKIGERTINMQRMFNVREGFDKKDDFIPERAKQLPMFGIYEKEERCVIKDYDNMLEEYYKSREWDVETGIPSKKKLLELNIEY